MADGALFGVGASNVWNFKIGILADGQHLQTGFSVRDVLTNDNDVTDCLDALETFADGAFKALMIDQDKIEYIDVGRVGGIEGGRREYTAKVGGTGISLGSMLPTFTAVNISLKRTARARFGQGRMSWPLRDDRRADGNFLNAGGIAAYQGAIDDLVSKFTGVSADLRLVNYHLDLPARPATSTTPARDAIPARWYEVETVHLDALVRFRKSRRAGIGT